MSHPYLRQVMDNQALDRAQAVQTFLQLTYIYVFVYLYIYHQLICVYMMERWID